MTDLPDLRELSDLQVITDRQVIQVPSGPPDHKVLLAQLDLGATQDRQAIPVLQDLQELKARKVRPAILDRQVIRVLSDPLDPQGLPDLPE